jgi:hypothetical protein
MENLAEDIPAAVSMIKKIDEIDRAGCREVFEDRFTASADGSRLRLSLHADYL